MFYQHLQRNETVFYFTKFFQKDLIDLKIHGTKIKKKIIAILLQLLL